MLYLRTQIRAHQQRPACHYPVRLKVALWFKPRPFQGWRPNERSNVTLKRQTSCAGSEHVFVLIRTNKVIWYLPECKCSAVH